MTGSSGRDATRPDDPVTHRDFIEANNYDAAPVASATTLAQPVANKKVLHHSDDENFDNDSLPIMKTSSYYDTNNFKSLINTKTNNFGVLSTNIQSINATLKEIEGFTQELRLLNYAFSVISIQESWLTEQDDLYNIQLEDYTRWARLVVQKEA